jgi:hypothetical protein
MIHRFQDFGSGVLRQANTEELPPFVRVEKVSVRPSNMFRRRGAGSTATDHLVTHEFSVVLTERTTQRLKTRIG